MSSRVIRASSLEADQVSRFKFDTAPLGTDLTDAPPTAEAERQKLPPQNPDQATPTVGQRSELLPQQARTKAAEIAELQLAQTEKEAYDKGFAEGEKARGEADEKKVESLLKQFSVSLEELNKLRREVFSTSEREVIHLALEVAKKVIHREVAIDEEVILTLVKVAMNRMAGHALAKIRVNPKDYQSIERHRAARPGAGPLGETVTLIEDPLIARGGYVIETESGTIDARIEEQLREIEKGFFE